MMRFKKHIVIYLAFFVLVSNSGLAFNVHYCGQKIAAISSVFSKEEVCDTNKSADKIPIKKERNCCTKEKISHKKCCSDKEVNLKNKTEKIFVKAISFDLDSVFFLQEFKTNSILPSQIIVVSQKQDYYCDANAPPLYKLYNQLILFG